MAEFSAFPLWTDAYLGDTNHLTTLEHGAYLLLLITAWRSKDNTLPNDDKMLCRFARLTPAQWKRIKPVILEFFYIENDRLVQPRLMDEINAVKQKSKRNSDAAKARWLNYKGKGNANASSTHSERSAPLPLPLPTKKNTKKSSNIYSEEFELFWKQFPKRSGDGKEPASIAFEKQLKKGVTTDQIMIGMEKYKTFHEAKGTDRDFMHGCAKWLNQKLFDSEYKNSMNGGTRPQRKSPTRVAPDPEEALFGKAN